MKTITPDNYFVREFVTQKTYAINYSPTSTGSVWVDEALPFIPTFDLADMDRNDRGIFKQLLHKSIRNIYFSDKTTDSPINHLRNDNVGTGSFYVVNIPQSMFGETVRPSTFRIDDSVSGISYIDNGLGDIIVEGTHTKIGNIFYSNGIAVIKKTNNPAQLPQITFFAPTYFSPSYFNNYFTVPLSEPVVIASGTAYLNRDYFSTSYFNEYFGTDSNGGNGGLGNLSNPQVPEPDVTPVDAPVLQATLGVDGMFIGNDTNINILFDSQHTIYEHTVICTADSGEFNYSINPSTRRPTYDTGVLPYQLFASGTLTPYITTVALMNDVGEILAVAKVPRPIKRVLNTQQTIIVRFDA